MPSPHAHFPCLKNVSDFQPFRNKTRSLLSQAGRPSFPLAAPDPLKSGAGTPSRVSSEVALVLPSLWPYAPCRILFLLCYVP